MGRGMRRRGWRIGVGLSALACASCTVVTALTDLDSERGTSAVEGGTGPGEEGGGPVGAGDACTGASCPSQDSGAFCTGPNVFFCADFNGPLEATWDTKQGAGLSVTEGGARSLVADVPGSADYALGSQLRKTIAGGWSMLRCTFSFQRARSGGLGYPIVFAVDVATADAGPLNVALRFSPGDAPLQASWDDDRGGVEVPFDFTADSVHKIGLEITDTRVKAFEVGGGDTFLSHPVRGRAVSTQIAIGAFNLDPDPNPWRFVFDDLECYATP